MVPQYTPMAPTLVREPFHRDGWVYEEKVDGWRIVAYKDGARVRLVSRNGVDHTRRFRDIAAAITKLSARTLVLDGEVAIYDQQLRSRFDWLRDPDPAAVASPPLYMAFDLLYRDGRDLSARPLRDRRAQLEDVVAGSALIFPVRRLAPDGLDAWAQVIERGYEGYVAKDEVSAYEGGATRRWLKVNQKGWTVEEDRWQRRISVAPPARWSSAQRRRPSMAAYVFFDVVSVHPERMSGYRDKALASIKAFNGRLVAATDNIDCREGDWHPTRIVMLEFPSMENARAWYESPEYQEVLPIRLSANEDKMVMFEGL